MKKRVFEILDNTSRDGLSRWVSGFLMTLIVVNVAAVVLETMPALRTDDGEPFATFELFSVIVFSVEYLLRLWSCTSDPRYSRPFLGRLKYALSPLALVDLAAVLPFYLPMMVADLDLRIVRAFRLVRLFRILKIGRYSESLQTFRAILREKKEELLITLFMAGILLVIVSSLMYFVENEAQPDKFTSIPAAMWWGVATLTTVGYGDIFPVTAMGKVLGTLSAIFGIGMFALPAGILGSAFVEEMHKKRESAKTCPHCGKKI